MAICCRIQTQIIAINKLDRENVDFDKVMSEITEAFDGNIYPLFLPVGKEANLKGVYDIVRADLWVSPEERYRNSGPDDIWLQPER